MTAARIIGIYILVNGIPSLCWALVFLGSPAMRGNSIKDYDEFWKMWAQLITGPFRIIIGIYLMTGAKGLIAAFYHRWPAETPDAKEETTVG